MTLVRTHNKRLNLGKSVYQVWYLMQLRSTLQAILLSKYEKLNTETTKQKLLIHILVYVHKYGGVDVINKHFWAEKLHLPSTKPAS